MTLSKILLVTTALVAFAANSWLCRAALSDTTIDAASFTAIRLASGAVVLFLLASFKGLQPLKSGSLKGASALFIYAAGFSFAYINMSTATGALLLFGSVQISMIVWGLLHNNRLSLQQTIGFLLAFIGLVALLLPGLTSPPLFSACLMIVAGIAWGAYTLMGKGAKSPLALTAGNFIYTVPMFIILLIIFTSNQSVDSEGIVYAVLSGAIASGLGYAIWYAVLPLLSSTNAATLQLSVPVIAAALGYIFLGEAITFRVILTSLIILGGILIVIHYKPQQS